MPTPKTTPPAAERLKRRRFFLQEIFNHPEWFVKEGIEPFMLESDVDKILAAQSSPDAPPVQRGVSKEAMEWFHNESAWYDNALIRHVPGSLNDKVQGYYHEILAALAHKEKTI